MSSALRVILIDDQHLVRAGIRGLLGLSDAVQVVAEADDGSAVVDLARQHSPDVILMDMRMPRMNGTEAIKALRDTGIDTPVIILTTFDDHAQVLEAVAAGATGYLLKDVSLEQLIDAIRSVAKGGTMIQPAITEALLKGLAKRAGADSHSDDSGEPLTARETEVLRLMAGGYSNREIAVALHNSEGTIKNHVSNILAKLGVRDRTRAVLKGIEQDLI